MMTLAAVLCCAMTTTVVNAQEAESPIKEGERLAKAADACSPFTKHIAPSFVAPARKVRIRLRPITQY
jgi:hypothetical protein